MRDRIVPACKHTRTFANNQRAPADGSLCKGTLNYDRPLPRNIALVEEIRPHYIAP